MVSASYCLWTHIKENCCNSVSWAKTSEGIFISLRRGVGEEGEEGMGGGEEGEEGMGGGEEGEEGMGGGEEGEEGMGGEEEGEVYRGSITRD